MNDPRMSRWNAMPVQQQPKPNRSRHRKKRFSRGLKIRTVGYLAEVLERGKWVFYNDRPKHPDFVIQMTFKAIQNGIRRGCFWETIEQSNANRKETPR